MKAKKALPYDPTEYDIVVVLKSFVEQHQESGELVQEILSEFSDTSIWIHDEDLAENIMSFLEGYRNFTKNVFYDEQEVTTITDDQLDLDMTITGIHDYCSAVDASELWVAADHALLAIASVDQDFKEVIHSAILYFEAKQAYDLLRAMMIKRKWDQDQINQLFLKS